jgi:adenosylcobinamide-phosphate synthase
LPGSVRGLVLGYILDAVLGDPRRHHPVALLGRAALALERRVYADTVVRGGAHWVLCVALPVAASTLVPRTRGRPLATALLTWVVLGQRSLVAEGRGLADALERSDLPGARSRLPALCGRDPSVLDGDGLARAGVESLAENTSDAVVAPLLWGAVLGAPGLVGYRVVNTLDAMVGHRSARYHRFGRVAAQADDLANLLPARVTAVLTCAAAPLVGGSASRAWRVWRRDGHRHPSPNAGQCEASAAGALGVRLGGENVYSAGVEVRPTLGFGRHPAPQHVRRAARLSGAVGLLGLGLAVGLSAALSEVRRSSLCRPWRPGGRRDQTGM